MDTEDFISKYPVLWHLTDATSWDSIQSNGLLSTQGIVRQWGVPAKQAELLVTRKRPAPVVLDHPEHGRAVLRDQHPLAEDRLAPALTDGMTIPDWLSMLNSFVFFFPSEAAVRTLYAAYDSEPAVVIKARTRSMVAEHDARIRLAGINTGNTSRKVTPRGKDTFLPIRRFDHTKRNVKEIAVMDGVEDLAEHLLKVERWWPDGSVEAMWPSPG